MNPLIRIKATTPSLFIALTLACFGLLPRAQAVDPPPDGGYPGNNTAEGDAALFTLNAGTNNTAVGFNALYSNTEGTENTAVGSEALKHNVSVFGSLNTAVGSQALRDHVSGCCNTATGSQALLHNTTGVHNTAVGFEPLRDNTEGADNTAVGSNALVENVAGDFNTAVGSGALFGNRSGSENTATGLDALSRNTTGSNNTAIGTWALYSNETGINNTACGYQALFHNASGDNNTGVGLNALYSNLDGIDNTASGLNALLGNTSGSENTATGHSALQSNTEGNDNTAVGHDSLFNNTTGSNNIAIGHAAGSNLTSGNNNIDIGFAGVAGEANTIRIGTPGTQTATYIAGISGTAIGGGLVVRINANGQLGTAPSSERFKQNITAISDRSDVLYALRPVTFRYKPELDPECVQEFGLVAEEVEKVDSNLVIHDTEGKPYTVRYDAVNAMLLNEFLKEHRKVEQLQTAIIQQKQSFEANLTKQQRQIETLAMGLQQLNARFVTAKSPAGKLGMSKSRAKFAFNSWETDNVRKEN
jgi:hypothetical protein